MVLSFFRKGGGSGLAHVSAQAVRMLGEARHSFDLATSALLDGADPSAVEADIRDTDQRINEAEQDLRSELVVHVSVHGPQEIGSVMGFTLLLKKIERIGDQAKNLIDLVHEAGSFTGAPDISELRKERTVVSGLFSEAADLLADATSDEVDEFTSRVKDISAMYQDQINEYMHSTEPANIVVRRAIYSRYMKRIVANLLGVVSTAVEPIQNIDYLDDGQTDITDD
jgi:phosphate transport system protein